MKIELTLKQWEALRHRLEETDCLIDAVCDPACEAEDEAYYRYHEEDVEAVIDVLLKGWDGSTLDTSAADEISDEMTDDILRDCIESSTWIGCADSEDVDTGSQKGSSARRVMDTLATIIEEARDMKAIKVPVA